MERIIDVYYGRDNLPYKDEARTIHFPCVGSEFLGASQTTTIRFHYSNIGNDSNVYTVESKRPDGKTGSQLLSVDSTNHYAEMSLSGWYSACKGDLYLSLKVYQGGSTATYDETAQMWVVSGVPVIQSTGAIKLAINYTPVGRYEDYDDAVETFQQVLGALGDKISISDSIVVVNQLSDVVVGNYDDGQLFYDISRKNVYKLSSGAFIKLNNKIEFIDVQGYEYEELYEKFGTDPFYSYFEESTNVAIYQFKQSGNDYALYVWTYKNGCLYMPYVDMSSIFSIDDFTNLEYEKAPVVELQSENGTLSDLDYEKVLQPNATIKFIDTYFVKAYEDDNIIEFRGYFAGHISSNSYVGYNQIDISKQNKSYRGSSVQELFYDKAKMDTLLSGKQNKLVSGTNIKTINGQSILGSGDLPISGGSGSAEWGSIGGDIADQTDLQDEFQEVREIATGRTRSAIISYLKEAPTEQTFSQRPFYDLRGNRIETWSDFIAFVNGRTFANSKFNSQNDDIEIDYDEYIIFDYHTRQTVYRGDEAYEVDTSSGYLNEGDIIIVKETTDQQGETIPDRWVYISDQTLVCSKLETSKVNLDNYSTKTQTSTEVNKVAHDIAVEYDENTLYGSGDLCIKDKLLYKCNTDNTTGTWDSTKWDLTTVNSELGVIKGNYVDLTSAQTITGDKTFGGFSTFTGTTRVSNFRPRQNATYNLGEDSYKWKDLYLSGNISDGTNSVTVAQINNNLAPTYDSTATYKVGDIVIYQGGLYQCNTAITTAEAFNSTHWTAISVSGGFATTDQIDYVVLKDHTQFTAITGGEAYKMRNGGLVPTFAGFNGNQRQNIFMQLCFIAGNQYRASGWFLDSNRNLYIFEGNVGNVVEGGTSNLSYGNFTEVKLLDLKQKALYQTLDSANIGAITTSTISAGWYANKIAISSGLADAVDVKVKMSNGAVYPAINNNGTELVIFSGTDFQTSGLSVTAVYYKNL